MDSQWLKAQFELYPEKSKTELARALGLDSPAISKILGGDRQIKAQEYRNMRLFFGLPVDGENVVSPGGQKSLSALPSNSLSEQNLQDGNWVIPETVLGKRTQTPVDKIKTFEVSEKLMEPEFMQGEHILIDLEDNSPSPPGVFVIHDGVGHILRHCELVMHSDPAEVKISAHSKNHESQVQPIDRLNIIGRVIAKLQWL